MRLGKVAVGLLLSMLLAMPAVAGRSCAETTLSPEKTAVAFDAALHLQQWLAKSPDLKVLAIARRGQNLDPYGVKFSHVAFLVKEDDGQWRAYHELNVCQSDQSNLFIQGLPEFFADDLLTKEIAIVAFQPEWETKLLAMLHDNQQRYRMHHANYSAVAYPYATKYQNSDGWIIESFVPVVSGVPLMDREQVQAMLKVLKYEPTVLQVGALKRLGGRMFTANMAFDDHPSDLRWSDRITSHTGDSLLRFFDRYARPMSGCQPSPLGHAICELDAAKPL